MYKDIGAKIKALAIASFVLGAIASVIAGCILIANNKNMLILGIIVVFVGPFISWLSSWLVYGFGELIDHARNIDENTKPE